MSLPTFDRRLGQHHLLHGELCRPVVRFLDPAGELVVEVGPGGGILTAELLAAGARIQAWEIDPRWAFELHRRTAGQALCLVVGDALEIPWERLPAGSLAAGNLPFNVASPILARLLLTGRKVVRAAFLVQREVAERLLASPGSRQYGGMSVLASLRAEVRPLGRVRRGSFRPPPRVEGAFVGFDLREPPVPWDELPELLSTIRAAFGMKRKTLRNALASAWGRGLAERVLEDCGFTPRTRAEALGWREFVALHRARIDRR